MKNANCLSYVILGPFSDMVTDVKLRQKFVSTSVTFLKKHKFDGLDLE